MNRVASALVVALAWCAGGWGQMVVRGDQQVPAHRLARLTAEAVDPKAAVIWDVSPDGVADVAEFDRSLVFTGPPGRYSVRCIVVRLSPDGRTEAQTVRTVVVIGDAVPPAPPVPPSPPADALYEAVAAIFGADQSPTKREDAAKLAQAYESFGPLVDRSETTRELFAETARIAQAAVPLPRLQPVRQRIAEFFTAELGRESVPLTPELRQKAKSGFARVAQILRRL
jgi:hypothetical protein